MTAPLDPWETRPRLLSELCEGHGRFMTEVYGLDLNNGVRLWLCKSCWLDRRSVYGAAGKLSPA